MTTSRFSQRAFGDHGTMLVPVYRMIEQAARLLI